MLELDSFGLTNFWRGRFVKVATKCSMTNNQEPVRNSRLSISHLSGTFLLLGIGLSLGTLAFLVEKIAHRCRRPCRSVR